MRIHEIRPLPDAGEMRGWDQAAAAFGLPEFLLMENAARAALRALLDATGPAAGKTVWLLMGGGNNGGDAACLARLLLDEGAHPLLIHARCLTAFRGAAGRHLRLARAAGVPFAPAARHDWGADAPDILVDGLLGTGFSGLLRPDALTLVRHVNALRRRSFLLSLDVPSGLDAHTGLPRPDAVRAHLTVTFEAPKPGLILPHARPFTGLLRAPRIGIPLRIRRTLPPAHYAIDAACASLLPAPAPGSHKGSFGHVLVVGGAPGMSGAAHLAARAALRTGCGLVSVAAPEASCPDVRCGLPDIMTLPLHPAVPGLIWPETLPEALRQRAGSCAALVVGPGMGRRPEAASLLRALLSLPERPAAVIDADALWHLAEDASLRALLRPEDIITPHPGEAARLLGLRSGAEVQADRPAALASLTALLPCVCVLKGAGTLMARRGEPRGILPFDVPSLALAGSGDILAGCCGALLAQGLHGQEAAGLAALLHAEAGLDMGERYPERGSLATQTADALPGARARLRGTSPHPPLTNLFIQPARNGA